MRHFTALTLSVFIGLCFHGASYAATYRIVPSEANVLPDALTSMSVEVETEAGDNLVGVGHYSFAVDLALSGTAAATGSDISNVDINDEPGFFDDLLSNEIGAASGNEFLGTAGVADDPFPPNFGWNIGDVVELFTFDLSIPATAQPGDTVIVTLSEGTLGSHIINDTLDAVAPQLFEAATLTVIPEPHTLALLIVGGLVGMRRGGTGRSAR